LNSALAISSFPDQGGGKNRGVAAGVDVMLNPGSQNGGVFLKQDFDICRH
jgi:hypothetical protein